MEVFLGAHLVRLRSIVRRRDYLTADEDARGVRLTTDREERATIWAVEFLPVLYTHTSGDRWVMLRGDYGGYLSSTSRLARTGGAPGAVLAGQQLVSEPAPPEMLWCPTRREGHVMLRNRAGGYLRANGKYLRWRTFVTVADDATSTMALWSLEIEPLGLRSVLIDPILHGEVQGHGNREVPQDRKTIIENRGQHSEEKTFSELNLDCLDQIALRLPSRADVMRLAATSMYLWSSIGSQRFDEVYYSANRTSMAELVGVLATRNVHIVSLSAGASVHISLNGLQHTFGVDVIDSGGGLLLLKDDLSGDMIVYDPVNGKSIPLSPPPVPEECELVAAGIVGNSSVMALYAKGLSSLFGQDTVWITTCDIYPGVTKWDVFDNEIDFNIKAAEIKPPSVVAGGEWHLLNYNSSIISVSLEKPHRVRTQTLPFHRRMLAPSHILGRTRHCKLALIALEDGGLTAWEYNPSNQIKNMIGEVRVYKSFNEFPQIPLISFALDNSLVLSDHLLCFNLESGHFELPFIIPDEELEGRRQVVPFEMPWPPRPVLEARPAEEGNIAS